MAVCNGSELLKRRPIRAGREGHDDRRRASQIPLQTLSLADPDDVQGEYQTPYTLYVAYALYVAFLD